MAKGKLTASLSSTNDGKKCFEMYHYDAQGRIVYKLSAYSDSWLKAVHTSYNFVGDVASCMESVYKHIEYPKYLLARRRTSNTYHPGTRLLASTTMTHIDKNRNTTSQVISHPTYDVFGNVTANDRPGTAADMAYDYDKLHGWLKGVSSPCGFSEQLQRETAVNAQFSGNIGSMQWRNTSNGELHHYDYTYDSLGRLTVALYSSSGNGTSGRYNESVTYNANGSITSLLRNGMKNDGTFGAIDDLTVTYDGNRLLKVTDDAEALNYNGALDFDDGDDADCEYQYDSNGALTYDGNRGITSISYDYGHHPSSIISRTKRKGIYNIYTPDGRKLSSQHVAYVPNGNGGNRRISSMDLYIDGLILRKGKPLMWQFDGGYVSLDDNGAPTSWNYYVTDHLGSTRMVVGNDSIRETINYYPFGSEMTMQDPAQMSNNFQHPYRFTGKELDRLNGLNMYDFGARWYDVAGVPMWTSVDPLAEKYYNVSPYVYCENNPVMLVDPDGKKVYVFAMKLPSPYSAVRNSGATHTFTVVKTSDGKIYRYAYGPTDDKVIHSISGTTPIVERDYYQDKKAVENYFSTGIDENTKNVIPVNVPNGMTESEFDKAVINSANDFRGNETVMYRIVPFGESEGNCNSSTTSLLKNAGVDDKEIDRIDSNISGADKGFGCVKPWTKEQRESAETRQRERRKRNESLSNHIGF